MRAIRVHQPGGREALRLDQIPEPEPGAGEARVAIEAAGVNFIDVYHRNGWYPLPLPATLGIEAAGRVVACGEGVTEVRPGDRVAYAMTRGGYAEQAVVAAAHLVPVPEAVPSSVAAALMTQGMTAHYLVESVASLNPGQRCLVYAAAGGVGLLLSQLARLRGAHVCGVVSTEEKALLATEAGAHQVLVSRQPTREEADRAFGTELFDVVFDSVGRSTFDLSLDLLRPRGLLALFGQSSGPVEAFDPQVLNQKGSLFLTRPTLQDFVQTRDELLHRATTLFELHAGGELRVRIGEEFALEDAAEAHRRLEERLTTGKLLLRP